MIFKTLGKSLVSAAAVTGLLAAGLVAGPAVESAQTRNVACDIKYPNSVVTVTRLNLERKGGMYGIRNSAFVKVTSDTGRAPRGNVQVTIVGVASYTVRLQGGEGSVNFPRFLPAKETYKIRASYSPPKCSQFMPSRSAQNFYTVKAVRTTMDLGAPDIRKGQRQTVSVAMDSATNVTPRGKVRVRLIKNDEIRRQRWATLSGGEADVNMGKVRRRGVWTAQVNYFGGKNFRNSEDSTKFNVRKRR